MPEVAEINVLSLIASVFAVAVVFGPMIWWVRRLFSIKDPLARHHFAKKSSQVVVISIFILSVIITIIVLVLVKFGS